MKKFVFASVLALGSMSLAIAPALQAQDQPLSIKDPAEFNAYQMASTQSDPKLKAAALESFLQTYPQTVAKSLVLNDLVDLYQAIGDADKELSADTRMLQVDPNNIKATLYLVLIKKQQGSKTNPPDAVTLDDAAAQAKKGLTLTKPAGTSADDWKKMTDAASPIFHSAIALDYVAKKDYKSAVDEYKAELMLYPQDQTKTGPGLVDTLNLAEAYVNQNPKKPDPKDLTQAVWFYSRAWDYAPAAFKPQIEKKLDYWYSKYHGDTTGLDAIKTQAQATLFPPDSVVIAPAATPQEKIHKILETTPDLTTLALADKELVLAYGSKEDADKLWALMKDKQTPVPGIVLEATASEIKVAVTDDAKQSKSADFVINLKEPLKDKDIPAVGFEFKLQPAEELDGTYDTYTQTPATETTTASAQIVLKDAFVQPEKKKAPVHKPPAAHHAAATH